MNIDEKELFRESDLLTYEAAPSFLIKRLIKKNETV